MAGLAGAALSFAGGLMACAYEVAGAAHTGHAEACRAAKSHVGVDAGGGGVYIRREPEPKTEIPAQRTTQQMKYIVSWTFQTGTFDAAVARFLKAGGLPPAGVKLIGRIESGD